MWEPDTLELTIDDVYVLDFPEDSDPGLVTHTFNPGDEVVAYNEVDEDNPEELVRGDISSGSATLEIQKIGELESDPDLADIADVDEINSSPVVFFVENTGAKVGGLYSANYDFDALTVKEQYIYFVDRATTLNGTLTEVEGPYFYTLDEVFDADGTTIGSETNFDYELIDYFLVPYLEEEEDFDENEDAADYYQLVYNAADAAGIEDFKEEYTDLTVFNSVGVVAGWNFFSVTDSGDDEDVNLDGSTLTIEFEFTTDVQLSGPEPTGFEWVYGEDEEEEDEG